MHIYAKTFFDSMVDLVFVGMVKLTQDLLAAKNQNEWQQGQHLLQNGGHHIARLTKKQKTASLKSLDNRGPRCFPSGSSKVSFPMCKLQRSLRLPSFSLAWRDFRVRVRSYTLELREEKNIGTLLPRDFRRVVTCLFC